MYLKLAMNIRKNYSSCSINIWRTFTAHMKKGQGLLFRLPLPWLACYSAGFESTRRVFECLYLVYKTFQVRGFNFLNKVQGQKKKSDCYKDFSPIIETFSQATAHSHNVTKCLSFFIAVYFLFFLTIMNDVLAQY